MSVDEWCSKNEWLISIGTSVGDKQPKTHVNSVLEHISHTRSSKSYLLCIPLHLHTHQSVCFDNWYHMIILLTDSDSILGDMRLKIDQTHVFNHFYHATITV